MQIAFTVGDAGGKDRIVYERVGGFVTAFSDFGEKSDGKPKYTGVTNGPSGLMMVKAFMARPEDYMRFDSRGCTIQIMPANEEEEKVFGPGQIEADEGVLLIDIQEARPVVHVWACKGQPLTRLEIIAAYAPKIEMTLTAQMIRDETYTASRKAFQDHMQMLQTNVAAEKQTAQVLQASGPHILGKGLPKRLRGRQP